MTFSTHPGVPTGTDTGRVAKKTGRKDHRRIEFAKGMRSRPKTKPWPSTALRTRSLGDKVQRTIYPCCRQTQFQPEYFFTPNSDRSQFVMPITKIHVCQRHRLTKKLSKSWMPAPNCRYGKDSLSEADVIDVYGRDDERAAARYRMNSKTGNGFQMKTLKTIRPPSVLWTTKVCDFIFPRTCDLRFDDIGNRNP